MTASVTLAALVLLSCLEAWAFSSGRSALDLIRQPVPEGTLIAAPAFQVLLGAALFMVLVWVGRSINSLGWVYLYYPMFPERMGYYDRFQDAVSHHGWIASLESEILQRKPTASLTHFYGGIWYYVGAYRIFAARFPDKHTDFVTSLDHMSAWLRTVTLGSFISSVVISTGPLLFLMRNADGNPHPAILIGILASFAFLTTAACGLFSSYLPPTKDKLAAREKPEKPHENQWLWDPSRRFTSIFLGFPVFFGGWLAFLSFDTARVLGRDGVLWLVLALALVSLLSRRLYLTAFNTELRSLADWMWAVAEEGRSSD